MKTFWLFLVLLALPLGMQAQWEPDFAAAQEKAAAEHKLILLNFSGSDWCAPCILFRKEYLDNPEFKTFADAHLILVNADFPRKAKNRPDEAIVKRNEVLADTYNKDGNFPYTLVLDSTGKVLKTWIGKPQEALQQWIAQLNALRGAAN